ncbi:hypothetical protein HQN87_30600 [Paenibacillus tritici]|uniref:Uncharacterized protein n=1 Tax=Paenibacillus tritici TaxID=1873425 RepID=A0ABX2DZJ1_9BACL|nr:hypothetical protein [Paenibacillus tritici]NQX49654.1 hypothetical protein [Paenibacillus tritici]
MEAIRLSIVKSRELGMNAWFYDENGWPSGFADGEVPAKGIAYQQKMLAWEKPPFRYPVEMALPGIFTDEPQFARSRLPWSFELEFGRAVYRRYFGLLHAGENRIRLELTGSCRNLLGRIIIFKVRSTR